MNLPEAAAARHFIAKNMMGFAQPLGSGLVHSAVTLGRLDDLQGRHAGRPSGLVISAHVFHLPTPGILTPNYEVQQAFWFPLADLHDPGRHVDYQHPRLPGESFPGILVGGLGREPDDVDEEERRREIDR